MPKRLIEVDLPIKTISAHARREKSIRHGHISTLHIWWARRPLAACRAVLCAALWPDPADPDCPPAFREAAAQLITAFARRVVSDRKLAESCSPTAFGRWNTLARQDAAFDLSQSNHLNVLRYALLDFIGDFANWDNSTVPAYLETARLLTHIAHLALTDPGFQLPSLDWSNPQSAIQSLQSQISHLPRPLVVDPFAGGGSIPLEALRIGADAFASDLNPVAVLLNKVVLEYIPKYGDAECRVRNENGEEVVLKGLAEAVRYWGNWIKERAEKELAEFYPKDPDGSTPIAYLWARTIRCEGPGCGAEVPLMRSLWLAKRDERSVALRLVPDKNRKRVDFEIIQKRNGRWYPQSEIGNPKSEIKNPPFDGTVKRGSATCPVCGYTTPVARVREQLRARRGGANDARLFCVVTTKPTEPGRFYRLPTERDLEAVRKAAEELERRKKAHTGPLSLVPDELVNPLPHSINRLPLYGMETWGDVFTPRQALALTTLVHLVRESCKQLREQNIELAMAVQTCLALTVDRQADYTSSLCRWVSAGEFIGNSFGRQALPMIWDFCEVFPGSDSAGGFSGACGWVLNVITRETVVCNAYGHVETASATIHPLPVESAHAFFTDPPYYDAVPYANLSDFFYVWIRRSLGHVHADLLINDVVNKEAEIVVEYPNESKHSIKDTAFYERELTKAFAEGRRLLQPNGIGTIVFASKTTSSWEAILQAVVDAGWKITGSWPIDTEMETRVAAQGQARLGSSVHLVCRRREQSSISNPHSPITTVGDWRDVLAELPKRIHEWMPRLAKEGVVGADAIFACLGPALEIFSRYERVETAGGKKIELREYLEHVWAAVGREALNQIFAGADPTGFEEDGRLTALWLWTLAGGANGKAEESAEEEPEDEDEGAESKAAAPKGFALEYDTARKLAQGIGAHLEDLSKPGGVVAIKGNTARLLSVTERRRALFGVQKAREVSGTEKERGKTGKRGKGGKQLALETIEQQVGSLTPGEDLPADEQFTAGQTTLDRIHQAMLLFGEGRSEVLKRFLVDDGVGKDSHFWRLAQALSALYPAASQEKRWVDGVLARKKGLGL
ncbi:MAG: DUF1156 domain-containing protein [Anaerolineales bacterium]|nr:DUF1156 domain-containing protein [Anaerolineales bacterium]